MTFPVVLALATERYAMFEIETLSAYPEVSVQVLRDDLSFAGTLSAGTFGPTRAAAWRVDELVLDVSTWSDSTGGVLEGNEALWGLADLGSSTRVFRIDLGGTITGTWTSPSQPSFTSLVGAMDGHAIIRNSAGSGSSDWTGRVCHADGSMSTIPGGEGSLFPALVGRLSDGEAVVVGQMRYGTVYHAFMWSLEGGSSVVDLHESLGLDHSSAVKAIDQEGRLHIATSDASYQWNVIVHDPVSGITTPGSSIPMIAGLFFNQDSGRICGAGTNLGQQIAWRSVPGGVPKMIDMPSSVLAAVGARICTSGSVLVSALVLEPVYQQEILLWPAGSDSLVPIQERTIGILPTGNMSVLANSPGGHAVISTPEGARLLVRLSPADVNGDIQVDVNDLLQLLDSWGPWDGPCGPDLDFDGTVDVDDVLLLLTYWLT